MARVPGANVGLGQGIPGGAGGLPGGLPLPGGGLTGPPLGLIPNPSIPKNAIGAASVAPLPIKINDPGAAAAYRETHPAGMPNLRDQQNLINNPASTKSLTEAMGILLKVEKGQVKPAKAAKLMQGLTPGDQGKLADLISSHFARTGVTDRNVLKALQTLQSLPAPQDAQPHTILDNFAKDAEGLVTGLPAGIGLGATYLAKDTGNALIPGNKPTSHFMDKIVKPIGHTYADTYGPLVHGDFGKFYEKFHAHPLGPVLDVASLFSAGAGTAGRIGAAGEAIDAARVGALADAAKIGAKAGAKTTHDVHVAYDLGFGEGVPGSTDLAGAGGALDQLGNNLAGAHFRNDTVDEALKRATGKDLNPQGMETGYQEHTIHAGSEAEAQSIARKAKETLSTIGIDHDVSVEPHDPNLPGGANWKPLSHEVPKNEIAPIGTQSAPKMGALDRIRHYLDTGPKNNGDLAKLTRVQPSLRDFKGPPADHPLDPVTGLSKVQLAKAGITGFVRSGPKGNLIELYDKKRGNTHEAEIQNYMDEIASVLDNSNLRIGRRSVKQVISDVASDIRATRAEGKARPTEMAANLPGFISANTSGRALSVAETSLREASDMVRAGAIVLRPAYIPNNWAGNTFMNVVHQGAFAPINLAKSVVIHNHMDPQNLAALRKAMGTNPAEAVTNPAGRGYVASLTQPIYHTMGIIADQPFRDAAFLHEARRAGYRTLKSVDDLFNSARTHGTSEAGSASLREIANISRKAQEEIVKFGHMNETERSVIRNLVFVYSWMRGAGRYAARFPAAHPIQTDLFNRLSGPGNQYIQSVMGGVPSFLAGSVPVGRDKNGNPILVNPFSLNPLGTGLQLAQAAAGTLHVIQDPKSFNKYAQNDVTSLLNPILGSYINARSGGQPMKKQLENTMAFLALRKGLMHPGSGSIYPTTRLEAAGHFTFGSLFPRAADQQAIGKALARQNVGNPAAMIPQQIKDFKKATGQDIPPQLVSAYMGDLEAIQMQKDFQTHYADSHGASGFRNMPPQNKAEAALQYLTQHSHLPPDQLQQLKQGMTQLTTDQEFNDYANSLWSMTGVGQYKRAWQDMLRSTKGSILTRKRK